MNGGQLRHHVQAQLRIGERALRNRLANAMRAHPTITRDDALLFIAADAGINISQYVEDHATLDRIRQLQQTQPPPRPGRSARSKQASAATGVRVTIARDIKLSDPVLPQRIINDAKLMAERVYPIMYIFENSVREVIQRVMVRAYGDKWWAQKAPKKVRDTVAGRMQSEKGKAWHSKRGTHEIYYTDIDELKGIVASNWEPFAPLFNDQSWFTHTVNQIAVSRHVVAHSNPISKQDLKRLEVNFTDWENQIRHCLRQGLL